MLSKRLPFKRLKDNIEMREKKNQVPRSPLEKHIPAQKINWKDTVSVRNVT